MRDVEDDDRGEVAPARATVAIQAIVLRQAGAPRDGGADRGVDVQRLAVLPPRLAQPLADDAAPHEASDLGAEPGLLDAGGKARPPHRLGVAQRRPVRPLDPCRRVPFRVGRQHGATLVAAGRPRARRHGALTPARRRLPPPPPARFPPPG